MNKPDARASLYERLLRRLLHPLYRALDEQQARQDRQRDELDAVRGHTEQARRQLRETINALEAQEIADREALLRANETTRAEAAARAESLAAALHDTHQRQQELRAGLDAEKADNARRSERVAAELQEIRAEQAGALAQLRSSAETRAAQQEQKLADAGAAAAQAVSLLSGELGEQMRSVRAEQQTGHNAQAAELARLLATAERIAAELRDQQQREAQRHAELAARLHAIEAPADGLDYAAFEGRFRGSEDLIRERQEIYVPLLQAHAPIADLGCGRGELVAILRAAGLEATGVENDDSQLAVCRAKAIPVEGADLFAWLEARPAASLGAITCLQVVEHLVLAEQRRFLDLAHRALRPDGLLLIETVNPHCAEAMEWFYIDPTHQRPVYPEMFDFLMEQAGFSRMKVRYQIPCTGAPPGQPLTAATGADFALWGFKP